MCLHYQTSRAHTDFHALLDFSIIVIIVMIIIMTIIMTIIILIIMIIINTRFDIARGIRIISEWHMEFEQDFQIIFCRCVCFVITKAIRNALCFRTRGGGVSPTCTNCSLSWLFHTLFAPFFLHHIYSLFLLSVSLLLQCFFCVFSSST